MLHGSNSLKYIYEWPEVFQVIRSCSLFKHLSDKEITDSCEGRGGKYQRYYIEERDGKKYHHNGGPLSDIFRTTDIPIICLADNGITCCLCGKIHSHDYSFEPKRWHISGCDVESLGYYERFPDGQRPVFFRTSFFCEDCGKKVLQYKDDGVPISRAVLEYMVIEPIRMIKKEIKNKAQPFQ